jgi:hypothetical protein
MNSLKRLLFGLLSSLLLAAGFAHAADRFDPVSTHARNFPDIVVSDGPTPPCATPCVQGGE